MSLRTSALLKPIRFDVSYAMIIADDSNSLANFVIKTDSIKSAFRRVHYGFNLLYNLPVSHI